LENASMIFDNVNLKPLYVLEMGKPGSSYAFEIAQKIGLSKQLIDLAKSKINIEQRKVDSLLLDLERDKKEIYDQKKYIEREKKNIDLLLSENQKLKDYFEENKRNIIKQAKLEAQQIIKNANKLIENTISDIKSAKAEKEKT